MAIIGSRGIPATYGGFEVFAEEISKWLIEHGFEVTVYTMVELETKEVGFPVHRVFVAPSRFKSLAKLSLSAKSMFHATLRESHDIILLLGASGVLFLWLAKLRGIKVILNPDGLEHQRQKWNWFGRVALKTLEAIGVKYADCVIADSHAIGAYIKKTYNRTSVFIPYGVECSSMHGKDNERACAHFGVEFHEYYIIVGRNVPENNFDMIIHAYLDSQSHHKLLIISDTLQSEFMNQPGIIYNGPVYDRSLLTILRKNAIAYFHGHSVGGTNPSLLEALACFNPVIAYNVPFNREVLGDVGYYFANSNELTSLIVRYEKGIIRFDEEKLSKHYTVLLRDVYNWDKVCDAYRQVFQQVCERNVESSYL